MSLKHRGGSKKMKKQMIYGKYDGNVSNSPSPKNHLFSTFINDVPVHNSYSSRELLLIYLYSKSCCKGHLIKWHHKFYDITCEGEKCLNNKYFMLVLRDILHFWTLLRHTFKATVIFTFLSSICRWDKQFRTWSRRGKELKEKNVNMESDSDDNNDDNHGNETELIDVALATTASGEKNPWMLPPSVKKVSEFSRLKEIVNKDNITKDKTTDTEEGVEENSVVNNKEKSGELDIDELFEEMQRKRGALHIEKDDDEFVGKKARKKKKAEKLKAKRKAKKEAEKLKKKQKLEEYVELGSDPESDIGDNDSTNKKSKNSNNKKSKKNERKRTTNRQEDNNNDDDDYNHDDEEEEIIHSSLTRKRTLEDMEGNWSDDDVEASSKKRQGNADVGYQDVTERWETAILVCCACFLLPVFYRGRKWAISGMTL